MPLPQIGGVILKTCLQPTLTQKQHVGLVHSQEKQMEIRLCSLGGRTAKSAWFYCSRASHQLGLEGATPMPKLFTWKLFALESIICVLLIIKKPTSSADIFCLKPRSSHCEPAFCSPQASQVISVYSSLKAFLQESALMDRVAKWPLMPTLKRRWIRGNQILYH